MKIKNTHPQFDTNAALFAVLGKEKGIVYVAHNGTIEREETIEEPAAQYSDREGFYMQSGNGMFYGAGEPYDGNEVQSREHFINKTVHALRHQIAAHHATHVYVFQPEHLKHGITEVLERETNNVGVTVVAYGTFLHEPPNALLDRFVESKKTEPDPTDPASVKDDQGAEEKRRILEIGKKISG